MLYYGHILRFLLCTSASAADAVVNPNESKAYLINGLAGFSKNGKAILVNDLRKVRILLIVSS